MVGCNCKTNPHLKLFKDSLWINSLAKTQVCSQGPIMNNQILLSTGKLQRFRNSIPGTRDKDPVTYYITIFKNLPMLLSIIWIDQEESPHNYLNQRRIGIWKNSISDKKTCSKLRKNFVNLIKSIYKNPMTAILFNGKRLNVLLIKPSISLKCLFILLLIIIVLEVLECNRTRQKEVKIYRLEYGQ